MWAIPASGWSRKVAIRFAGQSLRVPLDSLRGAYAQLETSTFEIAEAMYAT